MLARSRAANGTLNASLAPPRLALAATVLGAGVETTTGKRNACMPVCACSVARCACGSPDANASAPLSCSTKSSAPPAPVWFAIDTPRSKRSPGRANCGSSGLAISGWFDTKVASEVAKCEAARSEVEGRSSATAITRQVVRSSGIVSVALALPAPSVVSTP